jgi:hypothetical protein
MFLLFDAWTKGMACVQTNRSHLTSKSSTIPYCLALAYKLTWRLYQSHGAPRNSGLAPLANFRVLEERNRWFFTYTCKYIDPVNIIVEVWSNNTDILNY